MCSGPVPSGGKDYVGACWVVLLAACLLSASVGPNQHLVDFSASEGKPESVHSWWEKAHKHLIRLYRGSGDSHQHSLHAGS